MVLLLLAFLLFGQSYAKTNDFDQLVDRVVGHIDILAHFFGYDHQEILPINKAFYKKFLFINVQAGLECEGGSLEISSLKRLGPAQANIVDGSFNFTLSLEIPKMNVEVSSCTFSISEHFKTEGHYKALVNDTTIEVVLKVIQEGKKCRLQVTNLTVDIGRVYVYSGASYFHLLKDWTFDAVSYLVKDTVIEKANKYIQKIIKQFPQDLVSFPCLKPIKG